MTDLSKRILIAAVVAVVLVAGSVTAIALIDDDDDRRDGPLIALAEEIEERLDDREGIGGVVEEFLDRLLDEGDDAPRGILEELLRRFGRGERDGELRDRVFEFFGDLREDLEPAEPFAAPAPEEPPVPAPGPDRPRRDRRPFRGEERAPFEGFGFRFDPGGEQFVFPFGDGDLFAPFLEDGVITPEEAEELRNRLREMFGGAFGFGFGPAEPFILPGFPFGDPEQPRFGAPFGDLPLDEFLADGHISPDEARELERLFRDSVPGGVFRFEFVPPVTDQVVPDVFLEGLAMLPFREFLADGELSGEERDLLRAAVNEWLEGLFARIDERSG
jgi:hypothetical protein